MVLIIWIILIQSIFIHNAIVIKQWRSYIILCCTNGLSFIVMVFFGYRVAKFDPTDPVIYLQRMYKNNAKYMVALDDELIYEC